MKLKNATMAVCLSLCAAAAQAEVAVSASHHVVSAVEDAAGTHVTIDVTVRNNGEALADLTLSATELFLADGEPQVMALGALGEGETRVVRIETTSAFSPSFFTAGQTIPLYGTAAATAGVVEVSAVSSEEAR